MRQRHKAWLALCMALVLALGSGTFGYTAEETEDRFVPFDPTLPQVVAQPEPRPMATAAPVSLTESENQAPNPAPTETPSPNEPLPAAPSLLLVAPTADEGVPIGNVLQIEVEYENADRVEIEASWDGGSERLELVPPQRTGAMQLPPIPGPVTVTARAWSAPNGQGQAALTEESTILLSPREVLMNAMIDLAYANSKDRRYNFAPAQTDTDIGVCKNFVMRMFDTNKDGYYMLEYPDQTPLHMPKNNWKKDCAPYQYGVEWAPDGPETGNPFMEAARFRYDTELSKEENQQLAREFLQQAQRGDCYQMVGNYVDGNGPHSLLLIEDYDAENDKLHWTDSNMKGTRKNGVRWGWIQWDCEKTVDWMVKAICTKNRGATLYRLRDDLVHD